MAVEINPGQKELESCPGLGEEKTRATRVGRMHRGSPLPQGVEGRTHRESLPLPVSPAWTSAVFFASKAVSCAAAAQHVPRCTAEDPSRVCHKLAQLLLNFG